MAKTNVSLRLPDETIEEIEMEAKEKGWTKTQVMRYRIEHPQNGITPASLTIFQNLINVFPENMSPEQQYRRNEAQMEVNRLWQSL